MMWRRSCGNGSCSCCRNFAPTDRSVVVWLLVTLGLITVMYVYDFGHAAQLLVDPTTSTTSETRGETKRVGKVKNKNDRTIFAEDPELLSTTSAQLTKKLEELQQHRQKLEHHLKFTVNWTEWNQEDDKSIWDETPWHPKGKKSKPLCQRSQIVQGKWVSQHLSKPPYVPTVVHLRCYPRDTYYDKKGYNTYQWIPDAVRNKKCQFASFSSEMYCAMLRYATVMIVGDSLSWEHYASLIQMIGVKTHQGYQHMSRELDMNIGQPVCHGKSRLIYRRDDRLLRVRDALLGQSPDNFDAPIPQVLILNRGAHYANDTVFLDNLRQNLDIVEEWQDRCDELGIKCHFFWRTSVPGHPQCWNFTKPVYDKAVIENWIGDLSLYDEKKLQYHWYDFQHQNELVEKELQNRQIRHRILDAYHLNVLRPDEHRAHQGDCLHNCYPGKMDVYSRLLLHYLRDDRTMDDVDVLRSVVRDKGWDLNATTYYDRNATELAKQLRLAGGRNNPPTPIS